MSTPTITQSDLLSIIRPVHPNNTIRSGLETGLLTPDGVALLSEFIAEKRASVGICIGGRRFIRPFSELTIGDIYAA
ncbi:MAG: hypothetical protein METHP_02030 [Methanoregula sp. SKADARSKE-2]|nr:MAG: hypothetical protein METHP_02030 [Methanoregula sp. SKADARSKE-2]